MFSLFFAEETVESDEPPAKRQAMEHIVVKTLDDTGSQDDLQRQLEEVRKQAEDYKQQLKQKEEEAEVYKKQLTEITSKSSQ